MLQSQRVIYSDNGVNEDISTLVNDFRSGTAVFDYVAGEDYVYVGSDLPFNHKFIEVDVENDEEVTVSVDIWFSNAWVPAVDIYDQTAIDGCSLAQSGIIQWNTNRLKGWDLEQDSEDVSGITVSGIYNKYWIRLSWSNDLAATTEVSFIGQKFSNDTVLKSYYPDLNNTDLMTSFSTGKTSWDEQHFIAAEIIAKDLRKRMAIISSSQILDWELLEEPSCHKVAEIIYQGLGKAYDENRSRAVKRYQESINIKYLNLDLNANGTIDDTEKVINIGWLRR